jgi:homoserine kinase
MKTHGMGKRRDASEKAIVAALRQIGAQVWHLSGAGLPDLLIYFRRQFYVVEVKTAKGKLRERQIDCPWTIVRTPEDAFAAIGAEVLSVTKGTV